MLLPSRVAGRTLGFRRPDLARGPEVARPCCRGQRTRARGGFSHPSNDVDCLHGMDGNGLKTNRQSAHVGDCVVSVSKIISKKIPDRLLFRPKI